MSLYADYLTERTNKNIIEGDHGFIVYSISQKVLYIEDIYVSPDKRKSGLAKTMADFVCVLGKKAGCERVFGSVVPGAKNAERSLMVLVHYGMRLHSASSEIIYFVKDL